MGKPVTDSKGREWPECIPGSRQTSGSFGLLPEHKAYICSAKGRWEVDEKATERMREFAQEQHKRERRGYELFAALSTRVLTYEELEEVGRFGSHINTQSGVPYNAAEKMQELTNALLMQQLLQARYAEDVKQIARQMGGEG